jgi:zinc transport system ATP-binding protein
LLRLAEVSVVLGGRQVLEQVSLTLDRGEFLGLIGPNGGGKTTLLRVILGLLRPTGGRVAWTAEPGGDRPRIGYVPQRVTVEPQLPFGALEIVRQGAAGRWPLWGRQRRELNRRALERLDQVGLADHASVPFVHLSGGQQRRTLLARALMNDPAVLLLDEPTAGVDSEGVDRFGARLRALSRSGLTVLLVSHDIPLVMAHADRIACLARTLHWHGAAGSLDDQVIHTAFACELDRYQTRRNPAHSHSPNPDPNAGHHRPDSRPCP